MPKPVLYYRCRSCGGWFRPEETPDRRDHVAWHKKLGDWRGWERASRPGWS